MKTILILFAVCLIAATTEAGRTKRGEKGLESAAEMKNAENFERFKRQDEPDVGASEATKAPSKAVETTTAGASGIFKSSTPIVILVAVITSLFASIKI